VESALFHFEGGRLAEDRVSGPDPEGGSYFTWVSCSDSDGNVWLVQQIKTRLPGR
jgi:hypothetical protein